MINTRPHNTIREGVYIDLSLVDSPKSVLYEVSRRELREYSFSDGSREDFRIEGVTRGDTENPRIAYRGSDESGRIVLGRTGPLVKLNDNLAEVTLKHLEGLRASSE